MSSLLDNGQDIIHIPKPGVDCDRSLLARLITHLGYLSPGEVKLLQRGPKFAVSSPKVPVTEYIAVTKQSVIDLVRTLME